MIFRIFSFGAVSACLTAPGTAGEQKPLLLAVDFDSRAAGSYEEADLREDFGSGVRWAGLFGRARIVETGDPERGKALRVDYPEGAVGPRAGGAQFLMSLPSERELRLSYAVRFSPDFDFQLGGKLPGLTSGGGKYTGGTQPVDGRGWSARYMWRKGGQAVVYFYHVGMEGKWGDNLVLPGAVFQPGRWHRLEQRIRVNTPGAADGELEVWFDGERVLFRDDVRFRLGQAGLVDSFYFSTFHGGNTARWGPDRDCFVWFDEFEIVKP